MKEMSKYLHRSAIKEMEEKLYDEVEKMVGETISSIVSKKIITDFPLPFEIEGETRV